MTDLKILGSRPRYIWINEKKVCTHIVRGKVHEKTLIKVNAKLISVVEGVGGLPGGVCIYHKLALKKI
jgi:hypothetical protein